MSNSVLSQACKELLTLIEQGASIDEVRSYLDHNDDNAIIRLLDAKAPSGSWWSDDATTQVLGLYQLVDMVPLLFRRVGRPDVGDVVAVLMQHPPIGEWASIPLEKFTEMTGWSQHYIQRAIKDAKTAKMLLIYRGKYDKDKGRNEITRYRLTDPTRWDLRKLPTRVLRKMPTVPTR